MGIFPNLDIYAFEANPRTADYLKTAWKSNPRVHIINKAMNNVAGSVDIYDLPNNKVGNTGAGIGAQGDHNVFVGRVQSVPLSDFVNSSLIRSWQHNLVVKVDIEGFDLNALRGMEGLLSRKIIDVVQLEYNSLAFCNKQKVFGSDLTTDACHSTEKNGSPNSLMHLMVGFLESFGYDTFLVGPVFVPLTGVTFMAPTIGVGDIIAFPACAPWAREFSRELLKCGELLYEDSLVLPAPLHP